MGGWGPIPRQAGGVFGESSIVTFSILILPINKLTLFKVVPRACLLPTVVGGPAGRLRPHSFRLFHRGAEDEDEDEDEDMKEDEDK